jgi:hypothetical protein
MRLVTKLVLAGVIAGAGLASTGIASANVLAGKCPDGYYGVVVDDHDVCTNIVHPRCADYIESTITASVCP